MDPANTIRYKTVLFYYCFYYIPFQFFPYRICAAVEPILRFRPATAV